MSSHSTMTQKNALPVLNPQGSDDEMIDALLRETLSYFLEQTNDKTGLVADRDQPGSPASIAATGLGVSAWVCSAEMGLLPRPRAIERVLRLLRFLRSAPQGPEPDTAGYRGFFYHFLEMESGKRTWECELSTIDTATLIAGILSAASYFRGDDKAEREIREHADALYRRVDWQWALNGGDTLSHGWKPESGFLPNRWDSGYSEALVLYTLAAGSPAFPISPDGYRQWTASFEIRNAYGFDYIYAGPLFIHQLSHAWIDFRGIRDPLCIGADLDFFENSRRATHVQRRYGIENPLGFEGYGPSGWGLTASDGPGPAVIEVKGNKTEFFGYKARGAPFGPDDGTISPWAVTASLPFAPDIVLSTVRHQIERLELTGRTSYGFDASFNPTFPERGPNRHGWVAPWIMGLNQGPIILMIANHRSDFVWGLMRECPYIQEGLRRLGFRGGWLTEAQ